MDGAGKKRGKTRQYRSAQSGVKRLRKSSIVTARPPQTLHAQKTPPEVRVSSNGSLQRGQMSGVSSAMVSMLVRSD